MYNEDKGTVLAVPVHLYGTHGCPDPGPPTVTQEGSASGTQVTEQSKPEPGIPSTLLFASILVVYDLT